MTCTAGLPRAIDRDGGAAAGDFRGVAAPRRAAGCRRTGGRLSAQDFEPQVLASAEALGQKYRFDRNHGAPRRRSGRTALRRVSRRTRPVPAGAPAPAGRCAAARRRDLRQPPGASQALAVPPGSVADLRAVERRDPDGLQHRQVPPRRLSSEDPRAVRRARSARSSHRQQAGGDSAHRQRTRCGAPAESPATSACAVRMPRGCSRWRARATSRWSSWPRPAAPTCSWRRSAGRFTCGPRESRRDRREHVCSSTVSCRGSRSTSGCSRKRRTRRTRCSNVSSSRRSPRRTSMSSSWCASPRCTTRCRTGAAPGHDGTLGRPAARRRQRARPIAWSRRSTSWSSTTCMPALAESGVRIVAWSDLDREQQAALAAYFRDAVLPVLTPLAIDVSRPFPLLVVAESEPCPAPATQRPGEAEPGSRSSRCPRVSRGWSQVGDATTFVLLEDIIAAHLPQLFPGQTILEHAADPSGPRRRARAGRRGRADASGGGRARGPPAAPERRRSPGSRRRARRRI